MIRLSDVPRRDGLPDSSDFLPCHSRASYLHDRHASRRLISEREVVEQLPCFWRQGRAQGASVLMVAAMVAAMVALGLLAYSGALR